MTIDLLALTIAAAFTGAAIYVNVVEQPARLQLDDCALLTEWKPSYHRGAAMQASLALIGFVVGLAAWWQSARAGFLIGAAAMIAPWPWTLLVIKSVNDRLLATSSEQADAASRALIVKWGSLHAVRTALGAVAFLWALAQ
jgi:uncharacterized membrane protein